MPLGSQHTMCVKLKHAIINKQESKWARNQQKKNNKKETNSNILTKKEQLTWV